MAGARTPLPLESFSADWVGGDIRGLSALAGKCYDIAPQIGAAASKLNTAVQEVTGAIGGLSGTQGWKGTAAASFSSAWGKDATAAGELAGAWGQIGGIVDVLAAELARLEHQWEQEAQAVSEIYGVQIDALTGGLSTEPTLSAPTTGSTPPGVCVPRQMEAGAARAYQGFVGQILSQAQQARTAATGALEGISQALLPPGFDSGQLTDDLDGLRSLWATPTAARQALEDDAGEVAASIARIKAWYSLSARGTPSEAQAELDRLFEEQQQAEDQLLGGLSRETATSAAAAGDSSFFDGLPDAAGGALKAVPYVGTTVGAGLTIWQDIEAGESPYRAVADGVVSSGVSLGVGTVVGGAVTAAVVLVAPEAVAAGAGIVAGGVAAVGVGDFVHRLFQENWTLDRQQYGVLGGTWHGVADSYDGTRHDLAHYGDDLNPLNW
jgi:uncharacterized protein YukE